MDFYNELTPMALGVPMTSAGIATLAVNDLPVGLHGIHADYSGSATDLFVHGTFLQTVSPASTATTLKATPATASAGATVTLTATVKALPRGTGVPDGPIAIFDGVSPIGSGSFVDGKFVLTTTGLSIGAHSLTALYGGSGNYDGSVSAAVLVTVS